ncbi:hypothetical protein L1987_57636 [Smallanthus sonchifolius]|uniref:Uncharacterized protein n=1 Tax=Smallanthus sonchifolius TaxID=185202 RepID=A0ACB9DDK3_9ASTR|nr:hypothetical protein L1987_57636 [Smallanthus sonchifolius]
MTYDYIQKKRSPCDKFMQKMRNILKLSSFPLPGTDGRSSSSHSPTHTHHLVMKPPKSHTPRRAHSSHLGGLDEGGSSSFIKIQGNDHHDIGRAHGHMQMGELNNSVVNLKASDYTRRFHERNKRDDFIGAASTTATTTPSSSR